MAAVIAVITVLYLEVLLMVVALILSLVTLK